MKKLLAIPVLALAAGISLTACAGMHASTNDPTQPIPTHASVSDPTQVTPAPTHTVTVTPAPKPAPPAAHAGEVYCTYKQMDTDVCTNGGYVSVSSSAYSQAIAEYGNASSLSGWFPLSQVQYTSSAPAAPAGSAVGNCGNGVSAGANTSCAFARNVANAYNGPGSDTEVVYSPATGQSYTMYYTESGDFVSATGGNNASVTFVYQPGA